MLLRSLKDRDHVDLVFNWQYFYYYVKTEGVSYLRKELGITDDKVAPLTFQNTKKNFRIESDDQAQGERQRKPYGQG